MKKIYLESLGCAKNQVDSEILLTYAIENGYERTLDPLQASVIVVNSCGFIEDAKKESIETLLSFRKMYPHAKIILAGCLAERYADEMDLEEADAIFGNHDLSRFPEILEKVGKNLRPVERHPYPDPDAERDDRKVLLSFPRTAYLKISEGCNHCCAYCAIPLIRGPLRSRPMDKIIKEAERLIGEGIYEISVIAQDLGAYGIDFDGKSHFVELMDRLSSLEGDFVLRMLYIHPDTFPEDLIPLVASRGKILQYFDIPFQHSSPKVLRPMGRTGDRGSYVGLVERIRAALPDAVVRSTLMLGFPGEDEEAFEDLKLFVRQASLDWMGSFLYSREEGTPAFRMRNKKEHDRAHRTAAGWQQEIQAIQDGISSERMKRFAGRTFRAIVEEPIEGEKMAFGRIYAQAPEVDGVCVISGNDLKPGDVCTVRVVKSMGFDLDTVKIHD